MFIAKAGAEMGAEYVSCVGRFLRDHIPLHLSVDVAIEDLLDNITLDFIPLRWPLLVQAYFIANLFDPLCDMVFVSSLALDRQCICWC